MTESPVGFVQYTRLSPGSDLIVVIRIRDNGRVEIGDGIPKDILQTAIESALKWARGEIEA